MKRCFFQSILVGMVASGVLLSNSSGLAARGLSADDEAERTPPGIEVPAEAGPSVVVPDVGGRYAPLPGDDAYHRWDRGPMWSDSDDDEDEDGRVRFGGWISQGISAVANNPADRFNGVVLMNDRHAEYQMSQLWLFMERKAYTGGYGWDVGGRVDVMYGTDAMGLQSYDGLEASWGQTQRFYQMALPQFYFDVAVNNWTVRTGRFITPIGYEAYEAPNRFFYSYSYLWSYAEPGTHFGTLIMWDATDNLRLSGGVHRGSDQFDDTDGLNALNFLGGISWWTDDERSWIDFYLTAEENGHDDTTTIFSLVGSTMLSDWLKWVIQYTWGQNTFDEAEWYGINQHFIYEWNKCWSFGMRVEWFRDDDGFRVAGARAGNVAQGPYVGNFYEVTLGANWTPRENLIIRPEVRWDWYNADQPGGPLPFDSGDKSDQFMVGAEVVWMF